MNVEQYVILYHCKPIVIKITDNDILCTIQNYTQIKKQLKKIDYANYMFIGNGYENSFIFSVNYVQS